MKTAIVYDRVNKWGGAERVLLALHELFPDAPLYTSVYHPKKALWAKRFPKVIPTFLNKVSYFRDKHELLGTFVPIAFEALDFTGFDLVISVTSEAAKGIITKPPTRHICYCLTPTRYLWSHYDKYFKGPTFKAVSKPVVSYLRAWDKIASSRPDKMVAISTTVQKRIKKYYDRDSTIIYPPVNLGLFKSKRDGKSMPPRSGIHPNELGDQRGFFLVVSRLVSYKRVDLAIEAFNELGSPLVVVGLGREEYKLKSFAKENINFVGELTDKQLLGYYQKARALIIPQEEDFGIVAIEAQAAGTPVIAYKAGGALDTVISKKTGIFFDKQDKNGLVDAIRKFDKLKFSKKTLIENAEQFSKSKFKKKFRELLDIQRF